MNLELTDEQKEALIRELSPIIDGDRYPFSPRIRVLKEVLGQLQPEPTRPAPLPRDGITSRRATGDTRDGVRVMATTPRRQQSNPIASAFEGWTIWPESEPGYFAELGRMIAAYARAVAGVHYLARHLSGLPDAKARAIFGRMRLPDLTDLIRQMMRINADHRRASPRRLRGRSQNARRRRRQCPADPRPHDQRACRQADHAAGSKSKQLFSQTDNSYHNKKGAGETGLSWRDPHARRRNGQFTVDRAILLICLNAWECCWVVTSEHKADKPPPALERYRWKARLWPSTTCILWIMAATSTLRMS